MIMNRLYNHNNNAYNDICKPLHSKVVQYIHQKKTHSKMQTNCIRLLQTLVLEHCYDRFKDIHGK